MSKAGVSGLKKVDKSVTELKKKNDSETRFLGCHKQGWKLRIKKK